MYQALWGLATDLCLARSFRISEARWSVRSPLSMAGRLSTMSRQLHKVLPFPSAAFRRKPPAFVGYCLAALKLCCTRSIYLSIYIYNHDIILCYIIYIYHIIWPKNNIIHTARRIALKFADVLGLSQIQAGRDVCSVPMVASGY